MVFIIIIIIIILIIITSTTSYISNHIFFISKILQHRPADKTAAYYNNIIDVEQLLPIPI